MNFWIGFACGIAASWALSLVALAVITAPHRRRREKVLSDLATTPPVPDPAPVAHPDLPVARFTHLTGLGEQVKGRDV